MLTRKVYSTHDLLRKVIRNEEDDDAFLAVAGNLTVGSGIPTMITIPAQDLASGVLSYVTNQSSSFRLTGISVHFDEPVIETISLYKEFSNEGYNTKIYSKETSLDGGITGCSDFCFIPDGDVVIQGSNGTQLRIEITNNGLSGVAYAIIEMEVTA